MSLFTVLFSHRVLAAFFRVVVGFQRRTTPGGLLLVLVFLGADGRAIHAAVTAGASPPTWSPMAEFSAENGNPHGVWSYGWMDTGFTTFTPLVNKRSVQGGYSSWYGWAGDETPAVGFNARTTAINGVPPGYLLLHPGNGNEPSVLRWTAPLTATVRVTGQFHAGDGGAMQVAVRHNNNVRFSATDAGSFDLTANVTAGDTLNFAVFGGYAFGSTGLQVTLAATTFSLPLTTGEAGKISLGALAGGSSVSIAVTGTGDLVSSAWQIKPDGSLVTAASAPFTFANNGVAYPAVSGFPAGDGVNRFAGGGANYDHNGSGWTFAGKQTTDTTDPAAIRSGAVVGTFASSPARADWFAIGNGGTFVVPTGGATLYVAVNESFSSDNHGVYTVTASAVAPANDTFANAVVLTGSNLSASGASVGAAKEVGEINHAGNAGGASVWWKWTAPKTGVVTVNTIGSTFDTLLAVYTGTAVNALTAVASDDNSGPANTSKLTFNATAGTTYQLAVDGKDSGSGAATGSITLNVGYAYYFTTLAGSAGSIGSTDGTGSVARFNFPNGVTADGSGNVFVADYLNHTVRKISAGGVVTTLAGTAGSSGSADNTGAAARFNSPRAVAVDGSGNVFVADFGNHTIRKITAGGVVTTLAGTAGSSGSADDTGAAARFNSPRGVAVDGSGNVFVADTGSHTIRKITAGGVVTTLAGTAGSSGSADGTGTVARFNTPYAVSLDNSGNVFAADTSNHTVRKITAAGVVTTLAGSALSVGSADGAGSAARFNFPSGVAVDSSGNVFVGDEGGHSIRKLTVGGEVTTLAGTAGSSGGTDGTGAAARFSSPRQVAVDSNGNVFVADSANHTIRKGVPAYAPEVATVSPAVFAAGASVTITGANFTAATTVTFNGIAAASFTVISPTTITATAPASLTAGLIAATGPGGTGTVTAPYAVGAAGSTFGTDADGWTLVSFTDLSAHNYTVLGTPAATFNASGGNPGGYISSNDPDGGDSTFAAPAAFLGNRTNSIGATLSYQLIHPTGALNYQVADVILVGNGVRLVWTGSPAIAPATASWTTVTVPLAPSAQWRVGTTDGAVATTADFQNVFSNLTGLFLRGEYTFGAETTGLDNVLLGVAVPGTPAVNALAPSAVFAGATVTLTGSGFTGATAVSFNGTVATSFTVISDLTLTAVVPAGATSGNVTVTSPGGTSATTVAFTVVMPAPSAQDRFDPGANGNVNAVAVQPDGKIVIGGDFTTLQPFGTATAVTRTRIARLNRDGTLDVGFLATAGLDGAATTLALQSDGRILLGGSFSTVNGVARRNLARLNVDGSLDSAFDPAPSGTVNAIVVRPDGKIVIGGEFGGVQPNGAASATARRFVARLTSAGALDPTLNVAFDNGESSRVTSLAWQPDGSLLIGGTFTAVNGSGRTCLARITPADELDPAFDAGVAVGGAVTRVVPLVDGRILLAGSFSRIGNQNRSCLAILLAGGTLSAFDPGANALVNDVVVQADGQIVVAGTFSTVAGGTRNGLARLRRDGTLDAGFTAEANNGVRQLALQPDGSIVVVGDFTTLGGHGRNRIARLLPDGSVERALIADATPNVVGAFAVQPDGKIILGGHFTSVAGTARNFVARLNADSTLDASFNPAPDGSVVAPVVLANGQFLIGGRFSAIGGQPYRGVARFNADGSIDPSFNPAMSGGIVNSVLLQPDGKFVVGGTFTSAGGQPRNRLARYNADGSIDSGFNPDVNGEVLGLALQSDGAIIFTGSFTAVGGQTRNRLARVSSAGVLDAVFNPDADGLVSLVVIQPDGKVVVTGSFTSMAGTARAGVARLTASGAIDAAFNPGVIGVIGVYAAQADGKLLATGSFTSANGIAAGSTARLNADGSIDPTFNPAVVGQSGAFAIQPDGKIILGGDFSSVGNLPRGRLARLTSTGPTETKLSVTLSTVTLTRNGPLPELAWVTFEKSSDGATGWTPLGTASRVGTTAHWQLTGQTLPPNTLLYLRARAAAPSGVYGASSMVEHVQQVYFAVAVPAPTVASLAPTTVVTGGNVTLTGTGFTGATLVRFNGLAAAFTVVSDTAITAIVPLGVASGAVTVTGPGGTSAATTTYTAVATPVVQTLYVATGAGGASGKLYMVEPGTAAATFVGDLKLGTSSLSVTGLAFHPLTKVLYGVTGNESGPTRKLVTIDPATAQATLVGTLMTGGTVVGSSDISFDANGTLFTWKTRGGPLGIINLTTAAVTDVGVDLNGTRGNGLVFAPDGTLYQAGPSAGSLFKANPATGALTAIAPLTGAPVDFDDINALASNASGLLYAVSSANPARLISIQPTTGVVTMIGTLSAGGTAVLDADAIAFSVATPAPAFTLPPVAFASAPVGGNVTLSVVATGVTTLTYQWRKFGQPIAGATTAALILPSLTLFDSGFYDVVVTAGGTAAVSSASRVVVQAPVPTANVLTASSTFAPRFENDFASFSSVTRTADGKVYVSGNFTSLFGALRPGFARLNADGTLDASFVPAPVSHYYSGSVYSVAVQSDGRVLIGGRFDAVGGVPRDCLARLNPDGTVDSSFVPPGVIGNTGEVNAIIVQPDGKILVAGEFKVSGVHIARLNPDGSRDATFVPGNGFNNSVYALTLQSDGAIIAGGRFSAYNSASVGRIARLSSTGVLDTAYQIAGGAGFNDQVRALVLQPDGRLLVVGYFTTYGGSPGSRLVRLLTTGAPDPSFSIAGGFDNIVRQIALQPDGAVLVVGDFTTFDGNSNKGIVRLTSAGARDISFVTSSTLDASPGFNDGADGLALLSNGVLVLSNDSNKYASPVANTGPLTRLTALGALDPTYAPAALSAGYVTALVPAPGGKWLVGGSFSRVNGTPRGNLARLHADGTLDADFVPTGTSFNADIEALMVRPDGRILVGGRFSQFNGASGVNRLLQLTATGAVDTSFIVGSGFNGNVYALSLQADGKVVVGGGFTSYNGVARSRLVRLTPTGALDGTFSQTGNGLNSEVRALAVLNDGRLYVGGAFTDFGGSLRYRLARLLADGSLDLAFVTGEATRISSTVKALVVQPDGKLLVGGDFYSVSSFSTSGLARLNDDGTRDTSFAAFESDSNFTAFHLQFDGRIVVAGDFTRYGYYNYETKLHHLARLSPAGVLETAFAVPGLASAPTIIQPTATGALLLGGEKLTFPGRTVAGLALLEPAPAPAITAQPVTQIATVGGAATFTVTATGADLRHQWLRDGAAILGATAPAFTITAAQISDAAAVYSVRVFNVFGSVTSNAVALTGAGAAPTITGQPASVAISAGTTGTLTVTATGATHYQWRKLGAPLPGATTATLSLPAASPAEAALYDVLVGNGLSVTRSAAARLSVAVAAAIQNPLRVDRTFAGVLEAADSYGVPTRLLVQPDGSYYVAGSFTSVDGALRFNLARFSASGVLDPAFTPEVSGGAVNALARQADGKLVLVGDFHRVNGVACNHLARLNPDGTLDVTFAMGTGTSESLFAVAIQPDQKILIGGDLATYNGATVATRLARLNPDGSLDPAFLTALGTGFSSAVSALAVHPDGRIYVAGRFTRFNDSATANHLVALHADGTRLALPGIVADAFQPENSFLSASARVVFDDGVDVASLVVQSDGKLVVGGNFVAFRDATARRILGLNADGSADPSFIVGAGANGPVTQIIRQSDGQLYAAGTFSAFDNRKARVVRLTATGAFDRGYDFDGAPSGIALGAGNDLLVVGDFQSVFEPNAGLPKLAGDIAGTARSRFARFDAAGTLTAAQVTRWGSLEGNIETIVAAPGGKWLVGGSFSRIAGARISYLARLNADGTVDSSFSVAQGPRNYPTAIAVQGDGKILVGGAFNTYGNESASVQTGHLIRLNADGTLDASFKLGAGFDSTPYCLALQSDGRIVVGGDFGVIDGLPVSPRIVRLLRDGTVDATFAAGTGFDQPPRALLVQTDDKILVGGEFYSYNRTAVAGLVRLHANGLLDATFALETGLFGSGVYAILPEPSGQILIGGNFGFDRVNARSGVARLNGNGSFDVTTFHLTTGFGFPGEGGGTVKALALQADNRIIAAGNFSEVNGQPRGGLARLNSDGTVDSTFGDIGANNYSQINTVVVRADGQMLVGGGSFEVDGLSRQGLVAITGLANVPLPEITAQPVAQSAVFGGSATFAVVATGNPAPTFQWQRNSVNIPGATATSYTVTPASQANAGLYRVIVSNAGGSVPSTAVPFDVVTRNLINFYARAVVAPLGSIASSFTVEGTQPKTVLLLGVGGTRAAAAGFSGTGGNAEIPRLAGNPTIPLGLADPRLTLTDASGTPVALNNDWGAAPNLAALAAAAAQVAATPGLTATGEGALDAAILQTLAPGTYHVKLDGANGGGGAALLQIYDADTDGRPRLVMFTLRANVGSGDNVVTTGFTVDGTLAKNVLIRALGESLGASVGVLADPVITFYRGSTYLDRNDDSHFSEGGLPAAFAQVGARPTGGTLDSTLVPTVTPGVYTVQIVPYSSGESGTVLFELFEADAQRAATFGPVITYLAPDQVGLPGQSVEFGVVAVAKPGATYQWRKDTVPFPNATNPVFRLDNVQPTDIGNYDVVITSGAASATSPARTFKLLPEFHSADSDRDRRIGLIELTRIIQFYNYRAGTVRTGEYHMLAGTEDGFTLGPGAVTAPHAADSNRDGRIDIFELTRVIELYNFRNGSVRTGSYHAALGTEDGFEPGGAVDRVVRRKDR